MGSAAMAPTLSAPSRAAMSAASRGPAIQPSTEPSSWSRSAALAVRPRAAKYPSASSAVQARSAGMISDSVPATRIRATCRSGRDRPDRMRRSDAGAL